MLNLNAVRRLTQSFVPVLLLSAGIGAAASGQAQALEPQPVRELESVRLATFHIGNLSEVRIVAIPELGEVSVMEIIPAGGPEKFVLQPGLTPAEVFHRLAPRNAPAPEAIVATDERHLLADRALVTAIDIPMHVRPAKLGLKPGLAMKVGGGSCQDGAAGAEYFEENHCGTLGGPGYGSSESYCDSGAADGIQRTSGSTRRATYTRMASCGDGDNLLRHFYYTTLDGWVTQVSEVFAPGQVISWWSAVTGIKRDRRVRFDDHEASGWVRGWTKYHSEVADGWF